MAVAFVNSAIAGGSSVTSQAVTYSPVNGNSLLVGIALLTTSFTVSSITDSAGNVYVSVDSQNRLTNCRVEMWWCHTIAGSPTSVTVTLSGSAGQVIVAVAEYSGVAADGVVLSNSGSSTITNVNVTGADANNFGVSFFSAAGSGTFTANIGTLRQSLVQGTTLGGGCIDHTVATNHPSLNPRANISVTEQWAAVIMELRNVSPSPYIADDITFGTGMPSSAVVPFADLDVLVFTPAAPQAPTLDLTNDAEAQLAAARWPMQDGDLSDSGVELIQYGPGVLTGWVLDAEQQLAQLPEFSDDTVLDSGVELVQYGPGVISAWDAAEMQLAQPLQFDADDVLDSTVELIQYGPGVLGGWDIAEPQRPQPLQFGQDDVADPGVELVQYSPGVLTGWDTDADQQKAQPGTAIDHLSDEGVEQITLPPLVTQIQFWDTDAEPQLKQIAAFGQDDIADSAVELVQYGPGVLSGWDVPTEGQPVASAKVYDAEEDRQWINYIVLPPFVFNQDWTTDAENQRPSPATVSVDSQEERDQPDFLILPPAPWTSEQEAQLQQSGINPAALASDAGQDWTMLIIVPPSVPTTPWDTDAAQQLMVLPLRFADPHAPEWTNFPLGSPIVQRALATLKAQIVTQLAARSGRVIPKLAAQSAQLVGKIVSLGGRIIY